MVTGGMLSVVVTVTVTVTVAWPIPAASFSFTGTPIGADVMPASSVSDVDVDVVVALAPVKVGLSPLVDEDIAEVVETSGEVDDVCALFPSGVIWSFSGAVTTANNAFGIEGVGFESVVVVRVADGVAYATGELFNGLASLTC